jgi:hypothetical protein
MAGADGGEAGWPAGQVCFPVGREVRVRLAELSGGGEVDQDLAARVSAAAAARLAELYPGVIAEVVRDAGVVPSANFGAVPSQVGAGLPRGGGVSAGAETGPDGVDLVDGGATPAGDDAEWSEEERPEEKGALAGPAGSARHSPVPGSTGPGPIRTSLDPVNDLLSKVRASLRALKWPEEEDPDDDEISRLDEQIRSYPASKRADTDARAKEIAGRIANGGEPLRLPGGKVGDEIETRFFMPDLTSPYHVIGSLWEHAGGLRIDVDYQSGKPIVEIVVPPLRALRQEAQANRTDEDQGYELVAEVLRGLVTMAAHTRESERRPGPRLRLSDYLPDGGEVTDLGERVTRLYGLENPQAVDTWYVQYTAGVPLTGLMLFLREFVRKNSFLPPAHPARTLVDAAVEYGMLVGADYAKLGLPEELSSTANEARRQGLDQLGLDQDVLALQGFAALAFIQVAAAATAATDAARIHAAEMALAKWEYDAVQARRARLPVPPKPPQAPRTVLAKNYATAASRTKLSAIRASLPEQIRRHLQVRSGHYGTLFGTVFMWAAPADTRDWYSGQGSLVLATRMEDKYSANPPTVGDYLDNALLELPRIVLDQDAALGVGTNFDEMSADDLLPGSPGLVLLELRHVYNAAANLDRVRDMHGNVRMAAQVAYDTAEMAALGAARPAPVTLTLAQSRQQTTVQLDAMADWLARAALTLPGQGLQLPKAVFSVAAAAGSTGMYHAGQLQRDLRGMIQVRLGARGLNGATLLKELVPDGVNTVAAPPTRQIHISVQPRESPDSLRMMEGTVANLLRSPVGAEEIRDAFLALRPKERVAPYNPVAAQVAHIIRSRRLRLEAAQASAAPQQGEPGPSRWHGALSGRDTQARFMLADPDHVPLNREILGEALAGLVPGTPQHARLQAVLDTWPPAPPGTKVGPATVTPDLPPAKTETGPEGEDLAGDDVTLAGDDAESQEAWSEEKRALSGPAGFPTDPADASGSEPAAGAEAVQFVPTTDGIPAPVPRQAEAPQTESPSEGSRTVDLRELLGQGGWGEEENLHSGELAEKVTTIFRQALDGKSSKAPITLTLTAGLKDAAMATAIGGAVVKDLNHGIVLQLGGQLTINICP